MLTLTADSTDQSIDIFIGDSSSNTGAGLDGLAYNTSGLTCYYRRGHTGTATALTLATLATVGTAHADGGFKEIDATNAPGLYRLDLSDAIVASGVSQVTLYLQGAANMVPCVVRIKLETPIALADILDPFFTDARAEPTAVPAANATFAEKLDHIAVVSRNKVDQDSSTRTQTVYQADGTTVYAEATVSKSGTTTTRGELTTA